MPHTPKAPNSELSIAVLGATGIAGQQFLNVLHKHPWFKIAKLVASPRSAGKKYQDALKQENGQISWYGKSEVFEAYKNLLVEDGTHFNPESVDLIFSAVESDAAKELEHRMGKHRPVISTASAFRMESDTPLLIPGVNRNHAELIHQQKKSRNWKGFVAPIPNCTVTGLAIALAPLHARFNLSKVVMTSMQAISGAGRTPGVIGLDIIDNIVPYIPKEEEKVERELHKILGKRSESEINFAEFGVSATCTRVPIIDGHTESVLASFELPVSLDTAEEALRNFGKEISPKTHPSAPEHWITLIDDPFRPQVRLDRDRENGMTTTVGRLRTDQVLGKFGLRFVLVSHNTEMGAARGAVLVAEDLKVQEIL